jgi:hypothetical protein
MRPSLGLALDLEKVDGPASREIWCVRRGAQQIISRGKYVKAFRVIV